MNSCSPVAKALRHVCQSGAVGQELLGNPSWLPGTLLKKIGPPSWLVKTTSHGTVRCHVDHMLCFLKTSQTMKKVDRLCRHRWQSLCQRTNLGNPCCVLSLKTQRCRYHRDQHDPTVSSAVLTIWVTSSKEGTKCGVCVWQHWPQFK